MAPDAQRYAYARDGDPRKLKKGLVAVSFGAYMESRYIQQSHGKEMRVPILQWKQQSEIFLKISECAVSAKSHYGRGAVSEKALYLLRAMLFFYFLVKICVIMIITLLPMMAVCWDDARFRGL